MAETDKKMRVAMWYNNRDVRLEEMPVPETGPGELLVRVEACGLCGSDVMEWYRLDRAPLVLGHEIGGQIVKVGEGVECYKDGDRVSVAHHVPCNTCHYCLNGNHTVCDTLRKTNFYPGGLSEYVKIPAINVDRGIFLLPDEMSYEEATFIEPIACVMRGLKRTGIQPGNTVLVIGSGIAGLLYIQLAHTLGAGLVIATDISDYRLEAAKMVGANERLRAEEDVPAFVRSRNNGLLADIVIVCTGAVSAIDQAMKSVERGGTVLFFAPTGSDVTFPLSINELFWRNDITLTTSYAGAPAEYQAAMDLIHSGNIPVKQMVTHRLPLEKTGLGFQMVAGAENSIKIIIQPQK
ncbi:zinc-dependent dehydrogenase [Chloroflexota bacterium]